MRQVTANRAVTFDLWHTLIFLEPPDEDRYMQRQWDLGAAALLAPSVSRLAPAQEVTRAREAFIQSYRSAVDNAARGISVNPARQIQEAATALGNPGRSTEYLESLDRLVSETPFRRPLDALDVLDEIRDFGFRVGVISNTIGEPGRFLERVCEKLGLAERIDTFAWSDELPWTKPSPEIFAYCLGRLNVESRDALHIGDGSSDINGARNAGYRANVLFTGLQEYGEAYRQLFMSGDAGSPSADFEIKALSELPALLRRVWA